MLAGSVVLLWINTVKMNCHGHLSYMQHIYKIYLKRYILFGFL